MTTLDTVKTCSRCHEAKPISAFHKSQSHKDGHSPYCKSCHSQASAQAREKRRLQQKAIEAGVLAPPPPGTKHCAWCKEWLPFSRFTSSANKTNRPKHGLFAYCKECRSQRRKPQAVKDRRLKRLYGISLEEYSALLKKQNGVCAICRQPEKVTRKNGTIVELAVDRCHKTGRVRRLLCSKCNQAIGV